MIGSITMMTVSPVFNQSDCYSYDPISIIINPIIPRQQRGHGCGQTDRLSAVSIGEQVNQMIGKKVKTAAWSIGVNLENGMIKVVQKNDPSFAKLS